MKRREVEELKSRVANLEALLLNVDEMKRSCDVLENSFYRTMKLYEYRIWQLNSFTNMVLYRLDLKGKVKRKDFAPLVSIVIPVYNGANYLKDAIESALKQTYRRVEIIVVNDGSNDGGEVEKIAKKFGDRIRYYAKKNGGVSSALNFGISKMKGEYFAWLSHDDLMEPKHIANLVEYVSFKENRNCIPFSGFKIINENGDVKVNETISAQLFCYDFKLSLIQNEMSLLQGEINGGSVLIPRKIFEECGGFDEKQPITQERDMWFRIIERGHHFVNIPFDTALIREHEKRVTRRDDSVARQSNLRRMKIIKDIPDDTKVALYGSLKSYYEYQRRFLESNGLYEVAEMLDDYMSKELKV